MSSKTEKKIQIYEELDKIEKYMKDRVGLGTSFDLGVRKFKVMRKEVNLYYVNGLCDSVLIAELLEQLLFLNDADRKSQARDTFDIIQNQLVHQSVQVIEKMDELVDQVLSGLVAVVIEGYDHGLIIDVRSYPGRMPEEPDTEKVVRGSRDGFVENIIVNTAITRRRIRDERLRFEIMRVGERSKTDIAVGYIDGVADPDLIEIVKKEMKNLKTDGLTMADKTIEEFLLKQGYNPYPLVRYTERADVAATHLLEGHVIIYVDTSPSVIITPATFFHHLQHAEEYRQSPMVGTFVRWVRFLGIIASIFFLPFWFLAVLEPSLLPERLAFIGPNETTNIPIVVQIFIADLGLEFLRIAAIHTPTPLSTAMGLIAAVLIGQIAIDVGLFVPEVILYVSVAAIGNFATPSYELGIANKIVRLVLLIVVAIFHTPGFVIGMTLYLLFLIRTTTLNVPYLWPFIPFHPIALAQIIIRRAVPGNKIRPSHLHPQDRFKR
ncbi:spore germination protein [Niallia circulans]|jgi:stage V sporulation protein AF|uniref:Stage V sporulation protein AF n=1 Tax=Niallia circulans TaxID=1397 RepID=A0A0J1LFG3_NIACI|nr:spore germination protein [Niallia circulans]KLV27765.1 stage V sporulation protein AF [Niallia circulans]MCM2980947.1 spore germination protein [Niallia circulans]MDR4314556.1 spore germination protein [Niallia circulans]MED3840763.1 spore germination protein [Niallia circulans]MED4242717.1 spore germination protein [Niallia circulans]